MPSLLKNEFAMATVHYKCHIKFVIIKSHSTFLYNGPMGYIKVLPHVILTTKTPPSVFFWLEWNHSTDYEVRDLFPWEMFIKMVISCLLNVEKIWNSAQINLSSTLNFYRRYVFDATISTEKSTSEIDNDLAHYDMLLYLIPSRQLNLSYAN